MYTVQQAMEQIPDLAKTLNLLVSKVDSDTSIRVTWADGYYDIQTIAPDGYTVLLYGALDPISTWRVLNVLIDFVRQVHGVDRLGYPEGGLV